MEPDGVVGAGEEHARSPRLSGGLVKIIGAKQICAQEIVESGLDGDAAEVHDAVAVLDKIDHCLPIREIARRWNTDPARLHHDYARARDEFERSLRDVIAVHHPGSPRAVERELREVFADIA